MKNASFSVCINDLNEHFSYIGSHYHEENHDNYGIELNYCIITASMGFLAKGPGANVDRVPVENS